MSSAVPDLVQSFSKLLLDASGDTDTLTKFQSMISNELSNNSKNSDIDLFTPAEDLEDNDTDREGLEKLVTHVSSYFSPEYLEEIRISDELQELYRGDHHRKKYMWLSNTNIPYQFGGKTYKCHSLAEFEAINKVMDKINKDHNLELNSCLAIRYVNSDDALSLHQDDESILDESHPIVITPFGSQRTVEFWDSNHESHGKLIKQITPVQGDMLVMNVGCQTNLWHKVLPNTSGPSAGVRYVLSFRKLKSNPMMDIEANICTSTPMYKQMPLANGFQVHKDRAAPHHNTEPHTMASNQATSSVSPLSTNKPHSVPSSEPQQTTPPPPRSPSSNLQQPPAPPPRSPSSDVEQLPPASSSPQSPPHPPQAQEHLNSNFNNNVRRKVPQHLVIGDSLVKGLRVPGSLSICKGGIRPDELLQLLPGSTDILHPNEYEDIRTVTVIVGTNALNVKSPGKGMPLLDVVEDFEKLIHDLKDLFPQARIGLYNILPRSHTCMETVDRIELFNKIFKDHVANRLNNVFWIDHFWEFLDNRGSLRDDLYGRLGIHLKGKGKGMMARCIRSFQQSFN